MRFYSLAGVSALAVFLLHVASSSAQVPESAKVDFDEFFVDKAIRVELYNSGDATESTTSLRDLYEEPVWPENPRHLITPFEYGQYSIKLYDHASGRLIFSKGFDSMFSEYITTTPALSGVKKVFETTTRCPMPKAKVKLQIERRNREHVLSPVLTIEVDPADYRIRRETVAQNDSTFEIQSSGPCQDRVDIVFLAEGYTAEQSEKFQGDVKRLSEYLLNAAPYQSEKDKFNIRGVFRASIDAGTDEPRQKSFKSTVLNSTYNIFDLDRYLLVEDNHAIHRMAAQVPYDVIVVVVNTKRYGGGGMVLDYCTVTADNPQSNLVFIHEFGHTFGYLADEYIGNVAYNDMYPAGIEPLEPNITRETNRERLKWKELLSRDVPIPTPLDAENAASLVGAFEGGGYLKEGIYRSQRECWMGSLNPNAGLCVVCQSAIGRMIRYYTE
ncbi:MAG: M64 family metallopeptidase [Pirellulaceae bacterium]|nr:M64 family metallopeptidase [Pirellulaceae bacterium]